MKSIVMFAAALACLGCVASSLPPPNETVRVATANAAADELAVAQQLRQLAGSYDLSRWVVSHDVMIERQVIPHSDPVVTLNTLYQGDDDGLLAAFFHEQGHRYFSLRREAAVAAATELSTRYPDAPGRPEDGGARSQGSTWMHLLICLYESDALHAVLGEQRAAAVLARRPVYGWVYQRIVEDETEIRAVLAAHGLLTEY